MPKSGTHPQKAGSGTLSTQLTFNLGKQRIFRIESASPVPNHLSLRCFSKSSVPMPAKLRTDTGEGSTMRQESASFAQRSSLATDTQRFDRVVSFVPANVKSSQKVYDFEVEDDHCYYANGVLVSNSDAFRYACIAIKTCIDSAKSGISDDEADRMYNRYNPLFK